MKNEESLLDISGHWIVDPELLNKAEYDQRMRFDGKLIFNKDGSFIGTVTDFENDKNPYLVIGKKGEGQDNTPQLIMTKISSIGLPTIVYTANENDTGGFDGKYSHFEDGLLIPGPGTCLIQLAKNKELANKEIDIQINVIRRNIAEFIRKASTSAIDLLQQLKDDPYLLLSMPVFDYDKPKGQ